MKTFILSLLLALMPTFAFSASYEWLWKNDYPFLYVQFSKFTGDSKKIAVYDYEGTLAPEENPNALLFFDVTDGSITDSLYFGNFHIIDLCFSYDGNMMAVCGNPTQGFSSSTTLFMLYRTDTWERIDSINVGYDIFQIKFMKDNKRIILECDSFKIYNIDSLKIIKTVLRTPYDNLVTSETKVGIGIFDMSYDDKFLVYRSALFYNTYPSKNIEDVFTIYNIEADTIEKVLPGMQGEAPFYSNDGNYILTSYGSLPEDPHGENWGHAFLTNVNTGANIKKWDLKWAGGEIKYRFTQDSRYIYLSGSQNPCTLWDIVDLSHAIDSLTIGFYDISNDSKYLYNGSSIYRIKTTGIGPQKIMNKQNIINSIYPNPNSSELNVSFTLVKYGLIKIMITNNEGKDIKNVSESFFNEGNNLINININDLSNGIYYINIIQDNNIISDKFIINKLRILK